MIREEDASASQMNPELSALLILLLKGVLYREADSNRWSSLLRFQAEVATFVAVLCLELHIVEAEGYAYVRSVQEHAAEEEKAIPRLVARRQLAYYDSLLLALLRKRLAEFDASSTESRLVLISSEIVELATLFLPEHTDQVKLHTRLEKSFERLQEYGFLRKLKFVDREDSYEILRIIKAFVDAQWLNGFEKGLAAYRTSEADRESNTTS